MLRSTFALAVVTASLLGRAAMAQDVVAGGRVARAHCAACHQTGRDIATVPGLAPSFGAIANTKGMTQTSVRVFLSSSHEAMPNYVLSERDIADVAAYIMSLRFQAAKPASASR